MRKIAAALGLGLALALGGAGTAFAGEVTGNGKATGAPAHANSECSFSGLEDGTDIPPGAPSGPGTTQNWGQIPKADRDFLTSIGVSPSTLCNGHLSPRK